ncbi:MAG: molybdenum cofactor biosynthesis protein MoaE [SAR324 cluster bacterium]|nr:molybdenum cofactor biosynthesis protein MoaE [SAR324 cluster bacterium]
MFKICSEPLDLNHLTQLVTTPKAGAINHFVGITRGNQGTEEVTHLEYEAYESMAIKMMEDLGAQAKKKFAIEKVAIHHRIGIVILSEASVIISVSSAHRGPAIEATHFLIEELKRVVPIWKKEFFQKGKAQWLANSQKPATN